MPEKKNRGECREEKSGFRRKTTGTTIFNRWKE
jgi:hypothetical protein